MNLADVIHKLEFSINAYQNLLDTNVQEGFIIGKCDIGTWHANTPLNKAYSDMIEALQISKKIVEQYLLSQIDYENLLSQTDYEKIIDANVSSVLTELYADIEMQECTLDHGHEGYYQAINDVLKLIQDKKSKLSKERN